MKTAKRICVKDHTVYGGNGESFEIVCGDEYLTSIEKDGVVTVFSGSWVHNVPVELFGPAKEGPGEKWDRPADIETALRIYREYANKYSHTSMETPIHSPFTQWCERQLA